MIQTTNQVKVANKATVMAQVTVFFFFMEWTESYNYL